MAKLNSSFKTVAFKYDVSVNGGTVGVHNMNVFLPSNIMVFGTWIQSVTDLVSGGAAKVDILTNQGATILSNQLSGTAGNYTDYNINTYGFLSLGQPSIVPVSINGGLAEPFPPPGCQIQIFIITAALTAGAFIAAIQYLEFN